MNYKCFQNKTKDTGIEDKPVIRNFGNKRSFLRERVTSRGADIA